MTQTPTPTQDHPVPAAVGLLRAQLDDLAQAPVWSMTQTTSAAVLVEATGLAAQVSALVMRLAEHARSVAVEDLTGATSTANWWAHATNATRAETHRKLRLATALDAHAPVADALSSGRVLVDQAGVIVDAVDALPDDLDPDLAAQAEAHLLHLAKDFDAKALRHLGKGILTVIAPEIGEAHDAAALEREEREAAASARFSMVDSGDGRAHGRFTLPTVQAAMLKKALLAIAAPKHQAALTGQAPPPRPSAEKLGAAIGEYVSRYPAELLPQTGGVNATVVVTISLDDLRAGSGSATLDTGEALSPGQARRWACEAGIIPAVLGGGSQVLDLGRTRRFHTKTQRLALGLRDGGCTAEGCDWPPGLCHAHHDDPWHQGGHTNTTRGRLLCPRHHARAHDPSYEMTKLPGGKVAFIRRE